MCQHYDEICIAYINSPTCLTLAREILGEKEEIGKIKNKIKLIQKKIVILFQGKESNFVFVFVFIFFFFCDEIGFERDLFRSAFQLIFFLVKYIFNLS